MTQGVKDAAFWVMAEGKFNPDTEVSSLINRLFLSFISKGQKALRDGRRGERDHHDAWTDWK